MSVMKCTAAGDAMIFRQLPGHYEGFEALRDFIAQGELRFLNLETTIHNFETYGAALSGGSWFCAEPRVLDGVKEFGFNMLTTANNHAMDYSHAGLLKTLEYLQAAGLPTCGTGRSLAEAAAPIAIMQIASISAASFFMQYLLSFVHIAVRVYAVPGHNARKEVLNGLIRMEVAPWEGVGAPGP